MWVFDARLSMFAFCLIGDLRLDRGVGSSALPIQPGSFASSFSRFTSRHKPIPQVSTRRGYGARARPFETYSRDILIARRRAATSPEKN
jgi:hypothetical protein